MVKNESVNQDRIRLWIAALRSGEYKQGLGLLKYTKPGNKAPSYCCLGVACEVAKLNGCEINESKVPVYNSLDDSVYVTSTAFDEERKCLPPRIWKWYGLSGSNPTINNKTATVRNDREGASFIDIANMLEEMIR